MPSIQEMSDSELLALYAEFDEDQAPELFQAILEEIERRNLDL
jgi:hypothetical protein